jgi:DNA-binding NtrC family response regulator
MPVIPYRSLAPPRTVVLASADSSFRQRVRDALTEMRWQVREAAGGAEALAHLDAAPAEALILDSWLPDLEIGEFIIEFEKQHADIDLVALGDPAAGGGRRSPRRNEVLFALRRGQDADGAAWDGAAWNSAPVLEREPPAAEPRRPLPGPERPSSAEAMPRVEAAPEIVSGSVFTETIALETIIPETIIPATATPGIINSRGAAPGHPRAAASCRLPEFIGFHPVMLEVSRRIRLVAPRATAVLVQGPTGSGKELVARALHRLSPRSLRPFVALNCAAIPETLLESELFGHSRGAFTGAVQGRTGRIEAAHGGTLFLDEIGEMPLALQAKLLRFVESGELQRVGENEPVRVDVRIVAATHRSLARLAAEGGFRSDLYYRLAVFLIRMPSLASRMEDLPLLISHFLDRLGQRSPAKALTDEALRRIESHGWQGNVRELEHVLERAWILAEERPLIEAGDIEFGDGEAA